MMYSLILPLLLIILFVFFGSSIGIYLVYFQISMYAALLGCNLINMVLILSRHYCFTLKLSEFFVQKEDFSFRLDFCFDRISLVMLNIVLLISLIVMIFSLWYMKGDPNYLKFFFYLNLFTFFMIILVLSDNVIQIFLGWEGIGLLSYLLINFWSTRLEANRSALKAIILNKIGDCFFYLFFIFYFFIFENFNLHNGKYLYDKYEMVTIKILGGDINLLTVLGVFLIVAAMAKSAQLFLHVWLPDAMEGPTPVSALLHAATMVTAGIFILIKFNWLFYKNINLLILIIVIGILTNLFASFTAMFQYDIKKIIAYSTASQLGLVFISFGLAQFNLALFHIFTHAFFKALLFLTAGIFIHYSKNKQDLRLLKTISGDNLIFAYVVFLIANLALTAVPFYSGYYSKDFILQSSLLNLDFFNYFAFFFLMLSVVTTAVYSYKMLDYLFWKYISQSFNINSSIKKTKYYFYNYFLYILVFCSIFSGFVFFNYFKQDFLIFVDSFEFNLNFEKIFSLSYVEISSVIIFIFIFLGFLLATKVFYITFNFSLIFNSKIYNFVCFFLKKFYFDNINYFLFRIFYPLIWIFFTSIDKLFIENVFVSSNYNQVKDGFLHFVSLLLSGNLKVYLNLFFLFLWFLLLYIVFKPIFWLMVMLAIIGNMKL